MIKPRKDSCFVYWIRLKDVHTDIKTEGYVGFTSRSVEARWLQHQRDYKYKIYPHFHLYRAFAKYGIDAVEILTVCEGSYDYCLDTELRLRSSPNIGWNMQQGGSGTNAGRTLTDEQKLKLSISTKAQMTPDAKAHLSRVRKELDWKLWRSPPANKSLWQYAEYIYSVYKRYPSWKLRRMQGIFNVSGTSLHTMLCAFDQGWQPTSDLLFQDFKLNYKNSDATKSYVLDIPSVEKRISNILRQPMPWENGASDKKLWLCADTYYEKFLTNPSIGAVSFGKLFNVSGDKFKTMLMHFKTGFNPNQCPIWLEFKENNKEKHELTPFV